MLTTNVQNKSYSGLQSQWKEIRIKVSQGNLFNFHTILPKTFGTPCTHAKLEVLPSMIHNGRSESNCKRLIDFLLSTQNP